MKKLLCLLGAAWLLSSGVAIADDDGDKVKLPTNALYNAECGSCHVPFPTRLLSANEWSKITARLDKHFGVDATVDDATLKQLNQYLSANSAAKDRTMASADKLPRITESRWFIKEHNEVAAKAWKRVKSPSNCAACHQSMNMRRAY
jgi:nitrate/TMAO reductase-like tetraheme cytochrome c subunit